MDFNVKSSNFQGFLLVSYARFRKISYLCPRIKAFFAYCKIQKRNLVVSGNCSIFALSFEERLHLTKRTPKS